MIPFFTNQKGLLDFSFMLLRFLSNLENIFFLHDAKEKTQLKKIGFQKTRFSH